MKKFLQFIKENSKFLINLSKEELEERLKDLFIEKQDIDNEINSINKILKDRKERSEEDYSKNLPESIFDFSKKQLNWIFENNNSITSKHLNISKDYFNQLSGVMACGFIPETEQFRFEIDMSELTDFDVVIKTIKFLGNNLKKNEEGYVKFGILWYHLDNCDGEIKYWSENEIYYKQGRYYTRKFSNIKEMLEYLIEIDTQDDQ